MQKVFYFVVYNPEQVNSVELEAMVSKLNTDMPEAITATIKHTQKNAPPLYVVGSAGSIISYKA